MSRIDKEFIERCKQLCSVDISIDTDSNIKRIQDKWYKTFDYSVYDDPYYFADLYKCYKQYSRKYLKSIQNKKSMIDKSVTDDIGQIKTVVDLGCGIGYSTLMLADMFKCDVYGTNIPGTLQWKLCEQLNVKVCKDVSEVKSIDLIFASEYFEHFLDPIDHLSYIVRTVNPKYFLISNSFGTTSIGHFTEHICDGNKYLSKGFGRIFNSEMRRLGYEKQHTKIFNDKPTYWKRDD